jgi:hypothetical protein
MSVLIIRYRPEGQSMRGDRNKVHTIYSQWKQERQAAMDARTPFRIEQDRMYQGFNANEAYYTGLPDRIQDREQARMPIAGRGAVTFFSGLSDVLRWGSKVQPLFTPLAVLSEVTEQTARRKSGIYD